MTKRRNFNRIVSTLIFILLIGSAFAIDWIFGVGFAIGFILATYNKIIDKNPLIPIFIFMGAFIIRYALFVLLPGILNAQNYISLGISILIFIILLLLGFKIKKGKWKAWERF